MSRLFSDDEELIAISSGNLVIVGAVFVVDGILCMVKGSLQGMGLQKYSAVFFFFGFWVVALPMSAMFVIGFGKGINHVWTMKLLGTSLVLAGSSSAILCTNWDKLVRAVSERLDMPKLQNSGINGRYSPL